MNFLNLPLVRALFCLLAGFCNATAQNDPPTAELIGGETVSDAPWMVALVLDKDRAPANSHFSGGVLIHPYWVLTAAHSVDDKTALDFEVLLGAKSFDSSEESNWRRVAVERIFVQPGYMFRDGVNDADIALLRLKEPVHDFAPASFLEDYEIVAPGQPIEVFGWGSDGGSARVLRSVELRVIDQENAQAIADTHRTNLHEDALPVRSEDGVEGICFGDSGGPLMISTEEGLRLAAVSSYVIGSCGTLGIGARLERYMEWIQSLIDPGFTEWAREHEVALQPGADDDKDGDLHFSEYAFGSDPKNAASLIPLKVDILGLSTGVRKLGVDYRLIHSSDLREWTQVEDFNDQILQRESLNDSYDRIVIDTDTEVLGNAQFVQLAAQPAAIPNDIPTIHASSFHVKGQAEWSVDPETQKLMQKYRFKGLKDGFTRFTFISPFFFPKIEVVNLDTGDVVLTAGHSGNIWMEADLRTYPEVDYEIRLTSVAPNTTGRFTFYFPAIPTTANILQTGRVQESILTTRSDYDGNYYSRSYVLRGAAAGETVEITMDSDPNTEGFRPYLAISDGSQIVLESAGEPVNTTTVTLTLGAGKTYYIFASTLLPNKTGDFTLSAFKQ